MRKLITAFKVSVDGKVEAAQDMADWAEAWSDDYGLTDEIDACVLGGKMYPGYERYWTGIQTEPDKPAWITGTAPTPGELAWARFAAKTPHYVLSTTVTSVAWPNTRILRKRDDIAALKQEAGKDIYLMGGAQIAASFIDAGLVDEIRLIVYPLIAGPGKGLFALTEQRRELELCKVQQLPGGKLGLTYGLA
ncbi:dihydrofolate reductase family protein [Bradyrhizobium neotropicale]|uniref:Dihydrofolate reductase n=1 Tax=Bradyrhizobium neotropicale TaxID=1497615 RepID=A0A176YQM3_9BRAD|nr:dihydrofolate reductase family protein [Bradyrhizobium neotropicale]OAF09129.1 dihydrofolate reductase [Bradyrhizobium neotropicale]